MRNRQRTRSYSGRISYSAISKSSKPTVAYITPTSKDLLLSSISDVFDDPKGQNECFHVMINHNDASFAPPPATPDSNTDIIVTYSNSSIASTWGTPVLPGAPIVDYTSALNQLIRDASGAMPLSANALVNVAELASLKSLVPSLLSGFATWGKQKSKIGSKSAKDLANTHLAYSFGLAPLLVDLRGFLGVRSAVKRRIKELERRNDRPVRISVRTNVIPLSTSTTYTPYSGAGGTHRATSVWTGRSHGCVSCRVSSSFVRDPASEIKLYSSALGLSSPLQTIWELIPFSFVIDWFVPIGNAFQRVEDKLGFHNTVRLLSMDQFVTSQTTEASCTTTTTVTASQYPLWNGYSYGGVDTSWRQYVRGLGIPSSGFLDSPSGWTLNRSALSMSLIAQKVFK